MTRSAPVVKLRHVLMVLPSGMAATATLPLSAKNPARSAPRRHDQLALLRFAPIPEAPRSRPIRVPLARPAIRCAATLVAFSGFFQGWIRVSTCAKHCAGLGFEAHGQDASGGVGGPRTSRQRERLP